LLAKHIAFGISLLVKQCLKPVVLRTSRLKKTQHFFETTLGIKIEESSISHFVIYAKDIRIVFNGSDSR